MRRPCCLDKVIVFRRKRKTKTFSELFTNDEQTRTVNAKRIDAAISKLIREAQNAAA